MASTKQLLKSSSSYQIGGKLWIECDGQKFFGPGPVELLEHINETGSINQAAKLMNMSYKKALNIINILNTQLSAPLVITQSGGEKGGGSVITGEARRLISYYKSLRKSFASFLEKQTNALNALTN